MFDKYKPRVLHLFNSFEPGEVEHRHFLLVKNLAARFDHVCWAEGCGELENGLERLGAQSVCGGFESIAGRIEAGGFDCVIMRTHRYFRDFAELLRRTGVPVIYVKDYLPWSENGDGFIDPELDAAASDLACERFFCGPSLKDGVAALGLEVDNGQILCGSIELERFPLEVRRPRGGLPEVRIGLLADLVPGKNQAAAVHALRGMLIDPRYCLRLAGDGHDREYAGKLYRMSRGLRVFFDGLVTDAPYFMRHIDVFLMVSGRETRPVGVMQAMACGVPVIAPDIGDVGDLLDHGRAGILYEPGDYRRLPDLVRSLEDPQTYAGYSQAGIERVREFDAAKAARLVERAVISAIQCKTEFKACG